MYLCFLSSDLSDRRTLPSFAVGHNRCPPRQIQRFLETEIEVPGTDSVSCPTYVIRTFVEHVCVSMNELKITISLQMTQGYTMNVGQQDPSNALVNPET